MGEIRADAQGIEGWVRTFRDMEVELGERAVRPINLVMEDIFAQTQERVHVYPEGATRPPRYVNPALHGRLRMSGYVDPAHQEGDTIVAGINYNTPYAEFERLGTRFSIPPVYGDNVPHETKEAVPQHAEHDFMRPWVESEDLILEALDIAWDEIDWRQ